MLLADRGTHRKRRGVQAEQAEQATTTVQRLRKEVEAGEASEEELDKAEGALAGLTGSLQYLQAEMDATLRGADVAFRRGLLGTQLVRPYCLVSLSSLLVSGPCCAWERGGTGMCCAQSSVKMGACVSLPRLRAF